MNTNTKTMAAVACALIAGTWAAGAAAAAGDWLVRGRIINISPNDDSSEVSIAGTPAAGSGVAVDSATTLDIDITYMLRDRIGLELLLDLSSQHDASATGSLEALGKIVEARVLPPALLLQYHFAPDATVRPYVGAGINYTYFFDEKPTGSLEGALGSSSVSLDDSWGLAAQVGADFALNQDWFANIDLKYINIETTAEIDSPLGRTTADIDINPWVFGVGFGRKF